MQYIIIATKISHRCPEMIAGASPLSVVRCPYVDLSLRLNTISNTIRKLESLILLPHSYPSSDAHQTVEIFWLQIKNMFNIKINIRPNTAFCLTWGQTTAVINRARPSSHRRCFQLLKTKCDRRNLLLTIIVGCVVSTSGMPPKSNKRRASFV